MNNLNRTDIGTLCRVIGREQMPFTPLASNERTWYGFFMECFESIANYFYPVSMSEDHPFTDLFFVAKGYYCLTEERFAEWNNRFSSILSNIDRSPASRGVCFDLRCDQRTAQDLITLLHDAAIELEETFEDEYRFRISDLEKFVLDMESFTDVIPVEENSSSLVPLKAEEYIHDFRFDSLQDKIESMKTVLSPHFMLKDVMSELTVKYCKIGMLLRKHIGAVLEEKAKSNLLLEESQFIEQLIGGLCLSENEKNSVQRSLRDYRTNQTIIYQAEKERDANIGEIQVCVLKTKIKQLMNEVKESKVARHIMVAKQKEAEALDLFESNFALPMLQSKKVIAYEAMSNVTTLILNCIEREVLGLRWLPMIRKKEAIAVKDSTNMPYKISHFGFANDFNLLSEPRTPLNIDSSIEKETYYSELKKEIDNIFNVFLSYSSI